MHRSRTGFWEAFRKEWGAFAGMLMVSPAHDGFSAAKGSLDFPFEDGEGFLKVTPMRTRGSVRRNQHVDKAIAAIGVVAR